VQQRGGSLTEISLNLTSLSPLGLTDELFEKAFGRPKGGHVDFDWAAMDSMSDSDNDQMDEIEAQMKSEWMKKVESEFQGCEDDAEEFFNKAQ